MRRIGLGLLLTGALAVSGCGFQPLYANPRILSGLGHVDVHVNQGRLGFLLKESVDDQFVRDRSSPPLYRLDVVTSQVRYPLGGRVNNVANRYELGASARYSLVELASGRILKQGSVGAQVSYDSADPPYAGVAAEQNAEERAAGQLADVLRLDLARYFGGLTPPPK